MEPCIKCTRSKLDTGQGVLGLVAPEDLLSACCLVLPLVLSALVSSCPFPSGLVPVGLQGLSWGSSLGRSWRLLGLSWALPGPLLASYELPLLNRFAHSAGPGIEGSVWQVDARWSSPSELGTPSGRAWGALKNQPPQGPTSSPEGAKMAS